jgi:hypothetical protein
MPQGWLVLPPLLIVQTPLCHSYLTAPAAAAVAQLLPLSAAVPL